MDVKGVMQLLFLYFFLPKDAKGKELEMIGLHKDWRVQGAIQTPGGSWFIGVRNALGSAECAN